MNAKLYLGGALALVVIGIYIDRKVSGAKNAASSFAWDVGGILWNQALAGAQQAGGAVLDAMPSSQVPAVVDMAGPTPDTGTLLYESALMGGGG